MATDDAHDSPEERLAKADRDIARAKMEEKIRALGGIVSRPTGESRDDVSAMELSFFERVLAWEEGPFSTHAEWLARRGLVFEVPEELCGQKLKAELWRLIESLAVVARVFLYHTNHLSDAELYAYLWNEVLDGDGPDFARTPDDACHWDLAGGDGSEEGTQCWLKFHASPKERRDWARDFPETLIPPRERPPYRRDHRLPVRD